MIKGKNGFTLIELLVVIAIIGVLATIIIASVIEAKKRAEFAQVISQFSQIEKAFLLSYYDEDRTKWWTEDELGLGGNPTLEEIIAIESGPLSTFSDYFPNKLINILSGTQYEYDYDDDTSTNCSNGSKHKGVNLLITNVDNDLRRKIDKYIDGDYTPYCGKITYDPNDFGQKPERMFYKIYEDGNTG
jgi:prepilin-type N-terminal cleavage/methylation domain-containing protein